jgi:SAM-dependent methyltransferase
VTPETAIQQLHGDFPFHGYTDLQGDAYLNIARTVQRHLPVGSKILDFGCGPCDKTAVLQFLGYQCSGYDELLDDWHRLDDNKEKILSFAAMHGIDLRIATGGALPYEKEFFDMVMMHDVLEHLHDSPRELVNDLLEVVKPQGYYFATVPSPVNIRKRMNVLFGRTNLPDFEGHYWSPGPCRSHIREYTKGDLVALADYLGLEIVELRSCNHMLEKVPSILRPLYIAITNIFTGWRDSWLLVARKKPGWVPRREPPREDLSKILQRRSRYKYDH